MPTLDLTQFSNSILNYWHNQYQHCECVFQSQDFSIFINPNLDEDYQVIQLSFAHKQIIIVSPQFAKSHTLDGQFNWADLNWHGADQIFYYNAEQLDIVKDLPKLYLIRPLTQDDQKIFDEFCQKMPAEDLENAFVALDHWLVYGVFVYGELVALASMYAWDKDEHKIADVGVVTLPEFRQQGHAKRLIRSISQAAILQGYEPQYRCQLDNSNSLALAQSSGLAPLLQWDVVLAD